MGNGEVLGRHEIEQFCCRLEVDDLVSDENLGVSKFVPRLLRFHDPGDGDMYEVVLQELGHLIKVSASLENSSSLRKFQSKRSGLILALDGRKCM